MKRLTVEVIPSSGASGIVIYGSGRHFSSGADLEDLKNAIREHGCAMPAFLHDNLSSFRFFEECAIPVVAAIRGVCLGSALELALFCHARVCGEGSVLGLPESTFGLMPGCGGISKMLSLAGRARTMELSLSGASFSPDEAISWKLVDVIAPKKDVVARAIDLVKKMSASIKTENGSIMKKESAPL